MLTIFNDPAGVAGRRRVPLDFGVSLQENIERHLSGGADAELRINGLKVDPLTDPRLDLPPRRSDIVSIVLRPRGFDPLSWYAIAAYVAVGTAVLVSLLPKYSVGDLASGKDSPNNKLTGQSNVARAYQAIPDVYGFRRIWPDLIQPSTVEYIDQVKYVTEWLCASRGKGTISAVQYAQTPIGDIDGSSFELFEPVPDASGYPERGVTTLNDVYETFASDEVNGQELPYAIAYATFTKTGTFAALSGATTFTIQFTDGPDFDQLKSIAPSGTAIVDFTYNPTGGPPPVNFHQTCTVLGFVVAGPNVTFTFSSAAWGANEGGTHAITINPIGSSVTTVGPFTLPIESDQIWWNTVFLRGLKGSVTIRAEWWQIDDDGVEIGGTRQSQDNVYTADTFDQRFYTNKTTPSGGNGRYRVQFQRRTVQADSNGADVAKLEEVYAVRHFTTKQLPGVTAMRVTTKATLAATGFSDRKFNLRWLRHVRTLASDDLGESRNFARAMAHIWTLAGNDIADLDTAALIDINSEHGEDSELLRFDGSLDEADMSLGERLQFVADTARCFVWRDGTKWTVTRDQKRDEPEMQFDYRNLAKSGESVLGYAAHLPASNDGVEVEYVDEASQSKKAYVRLNIAAGVVVTGSSQNPKKIKMLGCATQAQAENRAGLEARRLLYQRTNVNDTALCDAGALGLGALVRWVDPNDFGGDGLQAGEVMAIAVDVVTTSEPLDWKGEPSGRIQFTGTDGRFVGPPVICYPATGGARLASVPAGIFVADAERQCGSRYSFAVGLTEAELEAAELFTATEIKRGSDGTVSISLASYDERLYSAD